MAICCCRALSCSRDALFFLVGYSRKFYETPLLHINPSLCNCRNKCVVAVEMLGKTSHQNCAAKSYACNQLPEHIALSTWLTNNHWQMRYATLHSPSLPDRPVSWIYASMFLDGPKWMDATMNAFAVDTHSKCNGRHKHSYWRFSLLESIQYCILVFVRGAKMKHFKQHVSRIIGWIGVQLASKHSFQDGVYDATLLYCLAIKNFIIWLNLFSPCDWSIFGP